jgi:hypothetical protein
MSGSPALALQKKIEYNDGAVDDLRKAIELVPDDPGSWQYRAKGAQLMGVKIALLPATTSKDVIKTLGTEGRKWIDDAIDQAGKRPDLAGNMEALQRTQQELDGVLTKKGVPRT